MQAEPKERLSSRTKLCNTSIKRAMDDYLQLSQIPIFIETTQGSATRRYGHKRKRSKRIAYLDGAAMVKPGDVQQSVIRAA